MTFPPLSADDQQQFLAALNTPPAPPSYDTLLLCVLDRSGSMEAIRQDAVGGFNAFLREQAAQPGDARLTLVLFDHEYQLVHEAAPLSDVAPLDDATYVPPGSTALYDALGRAILSRQRLVGLTSSDQGPTVVVCVLTDGMENASHEFTRQQLTELIEGRRSAGWQFVFLAANQDAFLAAESVGIAKADAAAFAASRAGVREGFQMMSEMVCARRLVQCPEEPPVDERAGDE